MCKNVTFYNNIEYNIMRIVKLIIMMYPLLMLAPGNEIGHDIIEDAFNMLMINSCALGSVTVGIIYPELTLITISIAIAFSIAGGSIAGRAAYILFFNERIEQYMGFIDMIHILF